MKAAATEDFPEIEWEIDSFLETDIEERLEVWIMDGTDAQGNKYSGLGYYTCGELESIKDIQL